jgi:hypothetical protein
VIVVEATAVGARGRGCSFADPGHRLCLPAGGAGRQNSSGVGSAHSLALPVERGRVATINVVGYWPKHPGDWIDPIASFESCFPAVPHDRR